MERIKLADLLKENEGSRFLVIVDYVKPTIVGRTDDDMILKYADHYVAKYRANYNGIEVTLEGAE